MKKYFISIVISFLLLSGCGNATSANQNKTNTSVTQYLLQKMLDDSDLNKYFHVNVFPERAPLIVVTNNFIDEKIVLRKFDQPVVYMEKKRADDIGAVYLEISSLEVSNDKTVIKFRYQAEGIKGFVAFKEDNSDWILIDQEIIEM
jgi:hypothetical protein